MTAGFDIDAPPPVGVTWGREDGVLWVRVRPTRIFATILVPLFIFLGLASAIVAGSFVDEMGLVPYIFMDLAINLILLTYLFRYVVRVTSSEAIGRFRFCGFTLWRTRLPLETIVRIRRIHGRFSDGILMEGRKKLIYLVFLDREVATWLMAFFQSAIINEETGE